MLRIKFKNYIGKRVKIVLDNYVYEDWELKGIKDRVIILKKKEGMYSDVSIPKNKILEFKEIA